MGKINNKSRYIVDTKVTLEDYLIGSDGDSSGNSGKTKNYPISSIIRLLAEVGGVTLNLFKIVSDPTNSATPKQGEIFTNGDVTEFIDIESIKISKFNDSGVDLTVYLSFIFENKGLFSLKFRRDGDYNVGAYADVLSFVDEGNYYTVNLNIPEENSYGSFSAGDFFSMDITQKSISYKNENTIPLTIGGFFAGEPATPPEGLTGYEFNNKLLFPAIRPTISFNINSLTLERGSDYSEEIAINFTQGGAGDLISYSLEKDGSQVSTTQTTQFDENNIIANFTLQGKVSHEAGLTISADIISTSIATITQRLRIWFAPLSSVPTTSENIRGMANNDFDNVSNLTLSTGTTHRRFVVAVPTEVTTSASLSAQDVTNNVPYTYSFENTVNVILPDGSTEQYRVYALVVDNAYSLAANHIIQI